MLRNIKSAIRSAFREILSNGSRSDRKAIGCEEQHPTSWILDVLGLEDQLKTHKLENKARKQTKLRVSACENDTKIRLGQVLPPTLIYNNADKVDY